MAFSLPNIVIKPYHNSISPRSPPLCSLALRLRNTEVPVWTHESIGYPKKDISHWDEAIHYGVQLAQYLWSNSIFQRSFTEIAPCVLPCPKTQEHQSTCVDSWVHRVPKNGHQPMGTRQFTVAFSLPNIVIKPYLVTLFHRDRPLCVPLP